MAQDSWRIAERRLLQHRNNSRQSWPQSTAFPDNKHEKILLENFLIQSKEFSREKNLEQSVFTFDHSVNFKYLFL